ncbi:hypothetical protein C8R47DRAFT_992896, partial [Mycena vitilis]
PPLDCSLNFEEIIDHHIAHENRSAACAFGDETGYITDITHFEFARAAHRVAHLLGPQRQGYEGQVVALVALPDVLIHQAIVAGYIKAGLAVRRLFFSSSGTLPRTHYNQVFQISHRNSAAAIMHLLRTTGTHRVLTTTGSAPHLMDTIHIGGFGCRESPICAHCRRDPSARTALPTSCSRNKGGRLYTVPRSGNSHSAGQCRNVPALYWYVSDTLPLCRK